MAREAMFWSVGETETLTYFEVDDAVEAFLDDMDVEDSSAQGLRTAFGEIGDVTVTGYAHEQPCVTDVAAYVVEDLLEYLGNNFGNPEDYGPEPTQEAKDAAQHFVKVVLDDYPLWICEPVDSVTLNALEWAERERPHWFNQGGGR